MVYLGKNKQMVASVMPPTVSNVSGGEAPSSDLKDTEFLKIGKKIVAPWFDSNNAHPWNIRSSYMRKSSVLKSAIGYKADLSVSQGLFACSVESINPDGTEVLKPVTDKRIANFLSSRQIRKTTQSSYLNLYSFGNAFAYVIMGKGDEISIVDGMDAMYCRFGKKSKNGAKDTLYFHSSWHNGRPAEETISKFSCIDTRLPIELQMEQARKLRSFIYPLSFHTPGSIYYADEPWLPARESGHLDITLKVAEFTRALFDNQISIKYHVQIPYSYWEKLYPVHEYPTPQDKARREALITSRLDEIEESLCSTANSRKTIFSHYSVGDDGKTKDGWKIDVLEDRLTSQHYLPQAAASNAEVFTSMGINPSVKGLSMAAGPYANQSGGSNIREAFLVDSALAWSDRQEVNDLHRLLIRLMGAGEDVEVRTKATILTTLDTGAGTKKTVS